MKNHKAAMLTLQRVLGLTVLIEACLLAFAPARIHAFGKMGFPDWLRLVLAWGEIAGAVLFLVPRTVKLGGSLLLLIFLGAVAIHLLHGHGDPGALLIYAAAVFAVITRPSSARGKGEPHAL